MTQEEEAVLIIRGAIATLPEPKRLEVLKFHAQLAEMVKESPIAGLAIALIGAELSVQLEIRTPVAAG